MLIFSCIKNVRESNLTKQLNVYYSYRLMRSGVRGGSMRSPKEGSAPSPSSTPQSVILQEKSADTKTKEAYLASADIIDRPQSYQIVESDFLDFSKRPSQTSLSEPSLSPEKYPTGSLVYGRVKILDPMGVGITEGDVQLTSAARKNHPVAIVTDENGNQYFAGNNTSVDAPVPDPTDPTKNLTIIEVGSRLTKEAFSSAPLPAEVLSGEIPEKPLLQRQFYAIHEVSEKHKVTPGFFEFLEDETVSDIARAPFFGHGTLTQEEIVVKEINKQRGVADESESNSDNESESNSDNESESNSDNESNLNRQLLNETRSSSPPTFF